MLGVNICTHSAIHVSNNSGSKGFHGQHVCFLVKRLLKELIKEKVTDMEVVVKSGI